MDLDQTLLDRVVNWIKKHPTLDKHWCDIRFKNIFFKRKYFEVAHRKVKDEGKKGVHSKTPVPSVKPPTPITRLEQILWHARQDIYEDTVKVSHGCRSDHFLRS